MSAPGWALVSTCPAPTWLRLTGAAEPTVLLPRAGRDCGALGGRKVRRMPWGAGHRSGVPGTAAPGCPDGHADRTAAAVAASACWQILRLGGRASGLRCPLRTGRGLRVSAATGSGRGPASAARVQPAPPSPPRLLVQAVAELLPDVGHGRPLQRQGFLDSDGPVQQQSGGTGFALYPIRCLRQWVGAPPLLLGGGFVPFGELHEPVLYPQMGACCRAGCGRWESSVRGETAGPRCPPQPRSGPRRSYWPTGSAFARRRGQRPERMTRRAPVRDRAHSPAAR